MALTANFSLVTTAGTVGISPVITDAAAESQMLDYIWFNYGPFDATGAREPRTNANMAVAVRAWQRAVLKSEMKAAVEWHRARAASDARTNVADFSGQADT